MQKRTRPIANDPTKRRERNSIHSPMVDSKPDLPVSSNGERLMRAASMDRLTKAPFFNPMYSGAKLIYAQTSLLDVDPRSEATFSAHHAAFPSVIRARSAWRLLISFNSDSTLSSLS